MGGKTDKFAQIASDGMEFNKDLIIPQPAVKKQTYFTLDDTAVFTPDKKMETAEELNDELVQMRERYNEFLQDSAPKMPDLRYITYLTDFLWRMQTGGDIKNFMDVLNGQGNWENINVPHYGGPLGKATSYYRTSFNLESNAFSQRIFICFKGVDYKAKVFVNGAYIGGHEGFFAPFEFEITNYAKPGENSLLVVVENDFICGDDGDKIYAATGLGYDDPEVGWHHCPPGMGIYQDVYIETRPVVHIHDIFVRPIPEENRAEAWIEVYNCSLEKRDITIDLSVYGQNFETGRRAHIKYKPQSVLKVGMDDSLTEAQRISEGTLGKAIPLLVTNGINYFKIPFDMDNFRYWSPDSPYLYQIQIKLIDENENVTDCGKKQFGMRSFKMDTESSPKGALYLNGSQIRLRGSNTMGNEQQCVFKKDFEGLRDDILLAKICNMNFWRLTQRPVQPEVYEYCDRLGLMTQTDLPLFGVLRRNQFCEAVRQAEEMERLIRSHPCNIMITYINEPFPNASNRPHLHLTRDELKEFFHCADSAVRLNNPDRVIKQIDGDYNPPCYGLPDNHCYPAWYNSHGIEIGKLNKGYWLPVKPDWYYGCGEFGSEGLDPVNVMRKYYPSHWLPKDGEKENTWSPNSIVKAQTGNFHYFFYETQNSLDNWVRESHKHQKWATRLMTEAFRRDKNMTTFAIHLFIDAFPSGWMKTIMDVDRQPKPAYFAYREALTPLMANLRSDRFTFHSGEKIQLEAWICNDLNYIPENCTLNYQAKLKNKIISAGKLDANIPKCSSEFQGFISFDAPEANAREKLIIELAIVDDKGIVLHDTSMEIEVFEQPKFEKKNAWIIGEKAETLADELHISGNQNEYEVIIISDYKEFIKNKKDILSAIKSGKNAVFLELEAGEYEIENKHINIKPCGMLPVFFVARNTNHPMAEGFTPYDFRLWYDPSVSYITPIADTTFTADGFDEILTSGNTNNEGIWGKALAAAELSVGKGKIRICQVKLAGRTKDNPIAGVFAQRLIK